MLFGLKKLIGYWIAPVPACLTLLAVGLVLLCSIRRAKIGRIVVASGAVLFALLSNKTVSRWLVEPLEARYSAVPELPAGSPVPPSLAACRYVVVLGGGNGNTPGLAALDQLSEAALARLAEAVRLLRAVPEASLVASGPSSGRHSSHATKLEQAAVSLGIGRSRILRIEIARDTEDEALAVKKLAADAPVALVTSAWHMPRAIDLFRWAGVDVLPCPAGFSSHSDGEFHWRDLLWDVESLERSTFAVREYAGYIWIRLRGRTGTSGSTGNERRASGANPAQ